MWRDEYLEKLYACSEGGCTGQKTFQKWLTVLVPGSSLDENIVFKPGFDVSISHIPRIFTGVPHSHTFFEVVYVYSGINRQYINNRELVLESGDVCILPPGVLHTPEAFGPKNLSFILMIRKSTFGNTFSSLLRNDDVLSLFFFHVLYRENYSNCLIFKTGNDQELGDLILKMNQEKQEDKDCANQMLYAGAIQFFSLLIRKHKTDVQVLTVEEESSNDVMVPILRYIQTNMAKITLEDAANEFHYSVSYLSRMLKTFTGQNFTAILREVRLNKAAYLLKTTNLAVNEIAEQVGYNGFSDFYRLFRQKFKVTPAEYRKALHNNL